jgi:hypothetical protein
MRTVGRSQCGKEVKIELWGGAMCAKASRRCVVGFPAHGDLRRQMSERLGSQLALF